MIKKLNSEMFDQIKGGILWYVVPLACRDCDLEITSKEFKPGIGRILCLRPIHEEWICGTIPADTKEEAEQYLRNNYEEFVPRNSNGFVDIFYANLKVMPSEVKG